MNKSDFGDRMKAYENVFRNYLPRRMPCIVRLDGVAFHTYTRNFKKPWDSRFLEAIQGTAEHLYNSIQGCKIAYIQSDEISLLLTDHEQINTDAWFGKNIQKMCSVSAAMASVHFNILMDGHISGQKGYFDSRAFILPNDEVCNYFLWRQRDCERNSLNSLAQCNFPHNDLQGLSLAKVHDKLMLERNINWNDIDTYRKRGCCIVDNKIDLEIPIFSQDRNYIERFLVLDVGK